MPPVRSLRDHTSFLAGALLAYLLISAAYTWPLLANLRTALPSDAADPVFNASILRWNATTVPFSAQWWNAPHYYPAESVAAFTENLEGVSLIATPVYWLSSSAVVAYNVAYFLTWPLSGIAVCGLVLALSGRRDAAWVAGLAYAFTPYRTAEIAHIQSLSSYWLPIALLAAHRVLSGGRRVWLAVFGLAWLLQALCNGHYLLFGAIVVGLWLVYFCSPRSSHRAGARLLGAWAVASLPLLPILLNYSAVHQRYGLKRELNEILAYSARPHSWFEVTGDSWFWRSWLPTGKDDLFPGLTALLVVLVSVVILLWRHDAATTGRRGQRIARGIACVVLAIAMLATIKGLWLGPWSTELRPGLAIRMRTLNRPVLILVASLTAIVALTPALSAALTRRSALVFYVAMTLLIGACCFGPVLHVGDTPMLAVAPYRLLMALPGFDELRAPVRFWMLGVLCLSVSAGLGYAAIIRRGVAGPRFNAGHRIPRAMEAWVRVSALVLVSAALLLDGWMPTMRLVAAPAEIALESRDSALPLVELPLGVDWDWEAVYRAAAHQRRIFNGVSGYDPPHYEALRVGLAQRDPGVLIAMATLGAFEVVVDGDRDGDGAMTRYVEAGGAQLIQTEGRRRLYRVAAHAADAPMGSAIPIVSAQAMRLRELFDSSRPGRPELFDGQVETGWDDFPQAPGQWVVLDLGVAQPVGGLTHTLGRSFLAFPRRLEIQTSLDGQTWERAWEGPTASQAFLALVRDPLIGAMHFTFPARDARYVRLLQVDDAPRQWHIAELQIHRP